MTNLAFDDQPRYTIIRASSLDVQRISPLFDAYRQFYGQASDPEGAEVFLSERLTRGESVVFLAVTKNYSRSVGFVQLYPSFSSISMQHVWILNDLFVIPTARNAGVGRMLLTGAEDHARSTSSKGLVLSTARNNYGAQSLYISSGYVLDDEYLSYCLTF